MHIYIGQEINLTPPWRRISMNDIVKEKHGINFYDYMLTKDVINAKQVANERAKIPLELLIKAKTVGEILNIVFEETCESDLIQPTFITEHPIDISPLAKPHRMKYGLVERFEMFMVGREHANAFSELTDPIDQRERFNAQVSY